MTIIEAPEARHTTEEEWKADMAELKPGQALCTERRSPNCQIIFTGPNSTTRFGVCPSCHDLDVKEFLGSQ